MIQTSLKHLARYESLHPRFKQVIEFLATHDLSSMEPQRVELDGDNLFINIVESNAKTKEEQVLEVHRAYIDVQIPFNQTEIIGWKTLETFT